MCDARNCLSRHVQPYLMANGETWYFCSMHYPEDMDSHEKHPERKEVEKK